MKGLSKKKRVSTWLALGITVVSCFALSGEVQASVERTKVDEFANVLDVSASPTERTNGVYDTNYFNNFSDLGAWHGMATIYLKKAIKSYWVVLRGR
ncbi:hypothetical protein I4L63_000710 [Enterococcus faecalis]|nr:hypothetical protein [Enterococcus faecalis]